MFLKFCAQGKTSRTLDTRTWTLYSTATMDIVLTLYLPDYGRFQFVPRNFYIEFIYIEN